MRHIALTKGKYAIVDDEDYEFLSKFKWSFSGGYARCFPTHEQSYYMHRMLVSAPHSTEVDHINRNKLDNRRSNLRIVTHSVNQHNRGLRSDNTSGVKGVYWSESNKRWIARIRINGKRKSIGSYISLKQAEEAYRKAFNLHTGLLECI